MGAQVKHLPAELRRVTGVVVALLGEVVKEEGGKALFDRVENIRKAMTEYRSASDSRKEAILDSCYQSLESEEKTMRHQVALSFTLMLEVINACESAYRTSRLREKRKGEQRGRSDNAIVYVLTAHPTEARTTANIEMFHRIQALLIRIFDKTGEEGYLCSIIKHNLKLCWLLPVTLHEKPRVEDEAEHILSVIMRRDIFDTLLRADRDRCVVRIRTWVGGDKDGHPGVDERVMHNCLKISRRHLTGRMKIFLGILKQDIQMLSHQKLEASVGDAIKKLELLKSLKKGDFKLVSDFKRSIKKLDQLYQKVVGERSPRLRKIASILRLFPALVVPIELREDGQIVQDTFKLKQKTAISRMLSLLKEIAGAKDAHNYAQGFILSMCHSMSDMEAALKLVKSIFGSVRLPVIPLFETSRALEDSDQIVTAMLRHSVYRNSVEKFWGHKVEVMLGYSDSSKGMGVLPSRLGIAQAIRKLDRIISAEGLTPVFFHGSGGSVDRGGGSLQEQVSWWPKSALNIYKATIQGEMVDRTFTSPEVTLSGTTKIIDAFSGAKLNRSEMKLEKALQVFSQSVKNNYRERLSDERFFKMIEMATPYSYLSALKLGSRPTKRSSAAKLDLNSIRAIPWILCWTQTRTLFPTWWGIGSAWKQVKGDRGQVSALKKAFMSSPIFSSYIRVLGFTLSKVDLNVFNMYLKNSNLEESEKSRLIKEFRREFSLAKSFVSAMTGQRNILWYKPWLADSIKMRSSMIHPLNVLQILAFKERDLPLLRRSVAGISSGMMTTG